MARSRSDWVSIGFMIVWLTFWASAILVAVYSIGATAWQGEPAAAIFLAVWVAGALFAAVNVGRKLVRRLLKIETPRAPNRRHRWEDGMEKAPPQPVPPQPPRDETR